MFSAKDWALLKSWKDDGIPLPIVIEAIDSCFLKSGKSGRRKVISSLSYCRHAVKELWSERKELQIGSSAAIPELDYKSALDLLAEDLRRAEEGSATTAAAAALKDAASTVLGLATKASSVPDVEEKLITIESQLFDQLRQSLPDADRARLEAEAGRSLAGLTDEAVKARTLDANLRRLIRKQFGIPRLSLFG